jgi:hypothetical protein
VQGLQGRQGEIWTRSQYRHNTNFFKILEFTPATPATPAR